MISNDATPTDDQHNLLGFVTATKKYSPTDSRQTTTTLVSHIACDLVPFSRLDSQYFRSFVSALDQCYQVPQSQTPGLLTSPKEDCQHALCEVFAKEQFCWFRLGERTEMSVHKYTHALLHVPQGERGKFM